MTEPSPDHGPAARAATRAASNTVLRAAGELLGKFASLALVAVLAREEGAQGLGIFFFALAWSELTITPVAMGFDDYFVRRVAGDKDALERLFANVIALKLARAVPVVLFSWLLVFIFVSDPTTRTAIFVFTAALLLETLAMTVTAVFDAFERAGLVAGTLLTQRFLAAVLGIGALILGYGVIAAVVAYALGTVARLCVALWWLARRIRWPGVHLPADERADLRRTSLAFATFDLFSVGISRADAVLLSAFTTTAVVGLYGAAYRLLEATLFISSALVGAFTAMFTYLDEHSDPPIRPVFERALKATLILHAPCGVALAVLAEPVLELFFGGGFEAAVPAMRALAAVVVVLGVVRIAAALIISRGDPDRLKRWFGIALALNVALNLALVPPFEATGAALAMLGTELVLAAAMLGLAAEAIGRPRLMTTLAAPLLSAGAMAAAMWPLRDDLLPALPVGVAAYVAVFIAVERLVSPDDLRFLVGLVRRRLPSRAAA